MTTYSIAEAKRLKDKKPTRGPKCPKCGCHIPLFADLPAEQEAAVRELMRERKKGQAIQRLQHATGCSLAWAKAWVLHEGGDIARSDLQPCPYCGERLRTPKARQCRHCGHDWHEQVGGSPQ